MDIVLLVAIIASAVEVSQAADCCSAYTDLSGTYHPSELCADYCCWQISTTDFKVCCSDPTRQVPATERDNEQCVGNWINEHIWVPIVGGIVLLTIIIICTCCCCCGCCACCRTSPKPVVIHSSGSFPASTTVAMSNQTVINQNPMHYGYEQ